VESAPIRERNTALAEESQLVLVFFEMVLDDDRDIVLHFAPPSPESQISSQQRYS
jgi:hypothetical protein